jgi:hypothetical protein
MAGFPIDLETLISSVVETLKQQGAAREVGIIVASRATGRHESHDDWNGGQDGWSITFALDLRVYSGLTEDERVAAQEVIATTARTFFLEFDGRDFIESVLIAPQAVKNESWRDDAQAWLSGAGTNNQGRVRSDNIASRQHSGLLFRSQPEIHLFQAFTRLGITFAPLPVFVRGGATYARLEPDFLIIKDGVVMVVEVDGDTFHRETPAEAHSRLQPLDHEGATIERVTADECASPESAKKCADRILRVLQKKIAQRR